LQEAALIRPFDTRLSLPIVEDGRVQGIITWLVLHITEVKSMCCMSSFSNELFTFSRPTLILELHCFTRCVSSENAVCLIDALGSRARARDLCACVNVL
jgi:hypothetical protein